MNQALKYCQKQCWVEIKVKAKEMYKSEDRHIQIALRIKYNRSAFLEYKRTMVELANGKGVKSNDK